MRTLAEDIEYRTTPRGMMLYASEFFKGYKIVKKEEKHFLSLFQVKFYLLCHAIELLLKAYLLMKGHSVKEVKSKVLGHSLVKLADKVLDKKEVKLSPSAYALLQQVNIYYESKHYEYFQRGYKELVNIKDVENKFILLINQIKPLIQKDYLNKRRMWGS